MLPKTSVCLKSYDGQTKWIFFFIEDDDLLEKYNTNWDKVSAHIKKNSKPVCNKEFLKNKIKPHGMKLQIFMIKKFLRWTLIILA